MNLHTKMSTNYTEQLRDTAVYGIIETVMVPETLADAGVIVRLMAAGPQGAARCA